MRRTLVGLGLCLAACYSQGDPTAPRPYLEQHHPAVVRVALSDSTSRMIYAPRIAGDSIVGNAGDSSVVAHRSNTPLVIPLASVRFIRAPSTNPMGSTTLLLLSLVALLSITGVQYGSH